MKRLISAWILIFMLIAGSASATKVETAQDGVWKLNTTWTDSFPNNTHIYDTVYIRHSITLHSNLLMDDSVCTIIIDGGSLSLLHIGNNKAKIYLDSGSIIILNSAIDSLIIEHKPNKIYFGEQESDTKKGIFTGPDYLSLSNPSLPISLLSYTFNHKTKELSWTTATETNNDFFTINVVSSDGFIIESYTKRGQGNSSTPTSYSQTIRNNDSYILMYQTDYNGAITEIFRLYINIQTTPYIKIWPNPTDSFFRLAGEYKTIMIYDSQGREVNFHLTNNILSGLKPGYYIIVFDGYHVQKLYVN